ncbi:isopentenyl-diphosphate Delta-isomerase [Candidatus Aenigmatarchaeota archaeon]
MEERVVLVDENDNEIGTEEKIKAHQDGGKLHRAFSIFVFNNKKEMMLQKRAASKYHFGGLWTNTCCSHPRTDESIEETARKKLIQEMGFETELKELFTFIYKATSKNGLTEHELDHVLVGKFDGEPEPNPEEADEWKWISLEEIERDVRENPDNYTPWFKIALEKVIENKDNI